MNLENLGEELIDSRIIRAVEEMGFESFTPIQEQAIPMMLEGRDLIGQAQTGTGKTAAFGIPMLQRIDPELAELQGLILCPTRELAIQAAEEIRKFAKYMSGIRVLPVYGGQDISIQIRSLKSHVHIIVGTPGRVMDHMRRHTIHMDHVSTVVLDEADEMLNMGFREDMEVILSQITTEHQTALFSATMPQAILDITGQFQQDPTLVKTTQKELTVPAIRQYYYEVRRENKREVTARLLDYYHPKRTLVFCNTKRMVEELGEDLKGKGYFAEGLHGDLSQNMRDRVMNSFRSGTTDVLIATDVAARGIDIGDVELVINYDIPQDVEYYVHRIGRTGRAGKAGRSCTLVVGREIYKIREIEHMCKTKMTARSVPSVQELTNAMATKVLNSVSEVLRDKDLSTLLPLIEARLEDEDCTAMEMAAAFLKLQLGEEREEIPTERYIPSNRNGRSGDRSGGHSGNRSRGGYGEKSGDGRRSSRDGRRDSGSYGNRRENGRRDGAHSGKGAPRTDHYSFREDILTEGESWEDGQTRHAKPRREGSQDYRGAGRSEKSRTEKRERLFGGAVPKKKKEESRENGTEKPKKLNRFGWPVK